MVFDIGTLSPVLGVNQPGFSFLVLIPLLGPQGTQIPCSKTAVISLPPLCLRTAGAPKISQARFCRQHEANDERAVLARPPVSHLL
jgi:hypothetical protein